MNSRIDIYKHMNCIQMNMEYICKILNIDFSKMFIDSWDFYYKPNNDFFSPEDLLFRQFRKLKFETTQLRYLGIEAQEIDIHNLINLEAIKQYIDSHKALLLNIDSFHCPWHRGYMKTHIDHYCLVVGYSHETFICIDPYLMGNNYISLSPSQLMTGRELIYFIHSNDTASLSVNSLCSEIISDKTNKSQMFKMMELLLKDLSETTDSSRFYDYPEDVYLCRITRVTKFIADGRIQLGYLLEKLSSSHQDMEELFSLYSLLYHSGDLWNHLNSIFIKNYYAPAQFRRTKKKIIDYMKEIIEVENKIFCMMKSIVT